MGSGPFRKFKRVSWIGWEISFLMGSDPIRKLIDVRPDYAIWHADFREHPRAA